MAVKILVPLPRRDFDPSEAAVSWRILHAAGHALYFATPDGAPAAADPVMLSGEGLDVWGWIAGLRKLPLIGLALRANRTARRAYAEMIGDAQYCDPCRYDEIDADSFDALLLPGGHAKGMREYLESDRLQAVTAVFFDAGKPVAAICHGVVLAARSRSSTSGQSVLHGHKTTALTWSLEKNAWNLTRWWGRFWDSGYYRTYSEQRGEPSGYRGVQQEVTRALARPEDFLDVPAGVADGLRKRSGLFRDGTDDARPAFVVRDGRYVSARWPGDVHTFARTFAQLLAELEEHK